MVSWDSVVDFFNTSDNERKRDEYSKLVKYLNKNIPKAEKLYSNLNTGCGIEFKIMVGSPKDASGVLATMYNQKFISYQKDTTNLLTYYSNILSSFRNRLAVAQSKYEFYVEQCRIEDELRRQRIQEERDREERERAAQKAKTTGK